MSLILCLETSTEVCSVALAQNGKPIGLLQVKAGNAHASQLHVLVEQVLQEAGFTLKQMDAVAVCKGPGSYTGLRVGVSAAKGYCYALGIPLIAIDSLTSLVRHLGIHGPVPSTGYFVPMIDARRMEVYTAVFDRVLKMIEPIEAKIIEENSFKNLLDQTPLVFFGNGAEKCKSIFKHKNALFIDEISCNADGLCQLAHEAYINNNFENTAYFEPFYLKDFVGIAAKKLV